MIRYIRKPAGAMPAFTDKVLSDQEVNDIYAYLKTMPAPKPVKDIPLLNPDQIKNGGGSLISRRRWCFLSDPVFNLPGSSLWLQWWSWRNGWDR